MIRPAEWRLAKLSAIGLTLFSGGCEPMGKPEPKPSGPRLIRIDEVQPHRAPNPIATLELAGAEVPVRLRATTTDSLLTIEGIAHGEVIEQEVYRWDRERFSLVGGAGEEYDPPIDLLRFPMNVGDRWQWKGKATAVARPLPAEAEVVTELDRVQSGGDTVPAIKIQVWLSVHDAARPIRRNLTFWVVEGKGVVQREFGRESIRRGVAPR
jgi:hypothetical protein